MRPPTKVDAVDKADGVDLVAPCDISRKASAANAVG